MIYLKDGKRIPLALIRKRHPNMSIPDNADLTEYGYQTIAFEEKPEGNYKLTKDGIWVEIGD